MTFELDYCRAMRLEVFVAMGEEELLASGESDPVEDGIMEREELLVEQLGFVVKAAAEDAAVLRGVNIPPGPEAKTTQKP